MKLPASTQRALAALDDPAPAPAVHAATASASAFAGRPVIANAGGNGSGSSSTARPTPLRLHFVGPPHTTVIRTGTVLTPRQCQKQPVLAIPISAMLRLPPSVRFLALCLALDPPPPSPPPPSSSSSSSLSDSLQHHHHHRRQPVPPPSLHGVRADLVPVIHQDDERWIPLLHENGRWGAVDDPSHKPVIDFLAPVPAGPAPRRYVWLVWIQPDGVSAHDVLRATGLQPQQPPPLRPGASDHGDDEGDPVVADARRRARFDDETFEKELGLGDVVAANYFTCEPEVTALPPDAGLCGHR